MHTSCCQRIASSFHRECGTLCTLPCGGLSGWLLTESENNPVFDDINELDSDDSEDEHDDLDFVAAIAGRQLGWGRNVPRFDIDKLRPFEVMFC